VLANPGIYIPMRPVPKVASSSVRHWNGQMWGLPNRPHVFSSILSVQNVQNEEIKPVQTKKLSILIRFLGGVG